MTAQIGDIYKYRDKKYHLVAMSAGMPFDPRQHGLEAHASSTACYRGYWSEYAIDEDILVLKDLFLFNIDGNYPPLNGVEVSPQEFEDLTVYKGGFHKPQTLSRPAHLGHRVYRDVDMLIPYTGRILLGDGFLKEYYIHMGFQRAWAYKKLLEFVFEEGILVGCNDLSHYAESARRAMNEWNYDPSHPEGNTPHFVEDSFSLDYPDKVWWDQY